jgi:hypothetical protein
MTAPTVPTEAQVVAYNIKHRPSIWAQELTTLRGRPYRFEARLENGIYDMSRPQAQRRFLQEIMDDQHPWKAQQKARQLGLSENAVREALWFADQHPHTKQVYTFPTENQVRDFSNTRLEETIKDSPYLSRLMSETGDVDRVTLKKIRSSFIFFRSGATPKAGEGVDADMVTFDELDRMHKGVTVAFNESLSSSTYGYRRDVSTPSLPGVGVNESFQKSDQRHWFMECPYCGHFFTLVHDWPNCIQEIPARLRHRFPDIKGMEQTHYFQCMQCHEPVSDLTRMNGFWYALFPENKRVRGYQTSQLIAPWISATSVINKLLDYKLEQLHTNYVIGLPYMGKNVLITEGNIRACIDNSMTNPYDLPPAVRTKVQVGGDWGNDSWQIAGAPFGDGRIVLTGIQHISDKMKEPEDKNPHFERSKAFFKLMDAKRGVFDAGYGKDRNYELLKEFPARVYSCFYPNNQTDYTKSFTDAWNDNDFRVNVDRTLTLKVALKMFVDRKIIIPKWIVDDPTLAPYKGGHLPIFQVFIKHLTNLVSVMDIEDGADGREVINERIGTLPGGDHFGHAWNYLCIGLRRELDDRAGGSIIWL